MNGQLPMTPRQFARRPPSELGHWSLDSLDIATASLVIFIWRLPVVEASLDDGKFAFPFRLAFARASDHTRIGFSAPPPFPQTTGLGGERAAGLFDCRVFARPRGQSRLLVGGFE